MAELTLTNAIKTYPNGFEAVRDVSVEAHDGEFVVFVGPSGCGKSTLLRMIAGLETITDGEINLGGRVINDLEPADRDIAMVFQNYALYPHMTVRKNLAYGLINRKIDRSEIDRRVQEAAELLQIEDFLERKPSQLSGGQRQRVAMGRAIVREPQAFLFDEPLSNLDAKLRNQMRIEIKKLQQRLGVTSVYVTHDQVEAMTMADRIVVLNLGKVEQIGTPSEVYHTPASLFVASFIGAPAMNTLEVTIDGGHLVLPGFGALSLDRQLPDQDKVILGIRPERLGLRNGLNGDAGTWPFAIDLVEELGAGRLIHGRIGEAAITISQPSSEPLPGDGLSVHLEGADAHFFDPASGGRL